VIFSCPAFLAYIFSLSPHAIGYTDDVLEYIRVSVPKTMLADLKDSVRNDRSLNIQDKYGTSAVSGEGGGGGMQRIVGEGV
jgi:hypothetical protein